VIPVFFNGLKKLAKGVEYEGRNGEGGRFGGMVSNKVKKGMVVGKRNEKKKNRK